MSAVATKPRLGFLGLGWIGRMRMESLVAAGAVDVAGVADPAVDGALASLHELLERPLDGVVIATPNALHAEQAIAALGAGVAVFCQKPLGRSASETRSVVDAARAADRLLGVDLSYRHTAAARALRDVLPEVGRVYAASLVFHNAYGPDKPWFYDRAAAGGGCVLDLGTHLVDLALWLLGGRVVDVDAALRHHGGHDVEDFAHARLELDDGSTVSLACSWNLPAGCDCVFEASFYGEHGGVSMRNVDGSFYDFCTERLSRPGTDVLAAPPDDWGGRALAAWAVRLGTSAGFDPEIEQVVAVAEAIDAIYEAAA